MLRIICDVCADIPVNVAKERNITVMPMNLTVNGVDRVYNAESFDALDFYDGMRNGDACSTSQISTEAYKEFFTPYLEQGDDVIFACLSSGLSGSYNNSASAAEELKQAFPNQKIHSIDSLAASLGEGLFVLQLAKLRDEGKSFDEIVSWGEENKHNVMHWFTVDDLKYLRKGGRVSATSAIVGTILDIKPVLQCNSVGKLVPNLKVKGRKKSIKAIFESMKKYGVDINGQEICISHGDCIEDALMLQNLVSDEYPDCTFVIGHIGAVIGAHSGPGTLALFFMGEKRFL
jgi:DegV family protein with EDD domain